MLESTRGGMKTYSAKRVCLGIVVFLCVVSALPAQSRVGVRWSEIHGNPALRPESCVGWNCAGVSDPALLINADGTITTWFTTMGIWQDAQGFSAEGPYFGR